jgi:ribonuclease VapC
VVVDSAALLAVFFDEPDAAWVVEQFNAHAGELVMSTVNLTEVLIHLRDRAPKSAPEIEQQLDGMGIRFVPPDPTQARIAAEARLRYPLNLGDCFAYALAVVEDRPILTLDRDFRAVDRPVLLPQG